MTSERLRQIEILFNAARARPEGERAAVLAGADPGIRQEVEAMFAKPGGGSPRDIPAADWLPETETQVAAGTQLGPYRIESKIGAGGMGDVFRALDTRLHRPVAIKICSEQFSGRFEREARAIAALNHPHICTLYDVGPNYLVMELVEGETLAARLKKGALPTRLAIQYGAQIADALAAAHSKGIIHRDLKPGNVMIAKSGVKVLDFGLAKSAQDATLTASRVVMGTPAYMAPEQHEGRECDARTDIYALGLVLYEMATGKRLAQGQFFEAGTLPPQFAHVIERCLEADPADRWQTASDVRKELDWASKSQPVAPLTGRKLSVRWIAAAAVLACVAAAVIVAYRPRQSAESPVRMTVAFGVPSANLTAVPTPSPDGRTIVFEARDTSGKQSLWVRSLNAANPQRLPGTEDARYSFWSPDSRWIGFFAQGKLKKISPNGGNPQTIASIPRTFSPPAWNGNGDIVFAASNRTPLFRLRESDGSVQPLTHLNPSRTENSHRYPVFLPDGRHFLFVARAGERENNALYLGSLDTPETHVLMAIQSQARFLEPRNGRGGALIYMRDGALVARGFDGLRLTGEPTPVADNVEYNAASARGEFSAASNGAVIIFQPAQTGSSQLSWFDRHGNRLGILGPQGEYLQPRISPDSARVLFSRPDRETGNRDVWYVETQRGVAARVTVNAANDWDAIWSPDGRGILFGSDRSGGPALETYAKASLDTGVAEAADATQISFKSPRDTLFLINTTHRPSRDQSIPFQESGFRLGKNGVLATSFDQAAPRFSPDAKWIAYISNESGQYEVYVRPFAGRPAGTEGKIRISTDSGDFPVWSRDGKELYYMSGDLQLHAVSTAGLDRTAPIPSTLFNTCNTTGAPLQGASYMNPYDVAPDGRFLIDCTTTDPGKFEVLLNWSGR